MIKMKKGSLVEVRITSSLRAAWCPDAVGVVLKGPRSLLNRADHYLVFFSRTKEALWTHASLLKCLD